MFCSVCSIIAENDEYKEVKIREYKQKMADYKYINEKAYDLVKMNYICNANQLGLQ